MKPRVIIELTSQQSEQLEPLSKCFNDLVDNGQTGIVMAEIYPIRHEYKNVIAEVIDPVTSVMLLAIHNPKAALRSYKAGRVSKEVALAARERLRAIAA